MDNQDPLQAYRIACDYTMPIAPDMLAQACYEVARHNGFYPEQPGKQWPLVVAKAMEELREADREVTGSLGHAAEVRDAIMVLMGYHAYLQQYLPPGQGLDVRIVEKLKHNMSRGHLHKGNRDETTT